MGLLETYNAWAFKAGNKLGTKTPRDQSDGTAAVDYLPNDFQTEVRNRTPGNKVVTQATTDDATNGTFKTDAAFKYYSTLTGVTKLTTYKSTLVHKYNAQSTDVNKKFITSDSWKNSPGVLYSTNS